MDENTRSFLAILAKTEKLVMKIGLVTAFTTPTISAKLGGDIVNAQGTVITAAPVITGIRRLKSYTTPVAGDVVVLLIDEKKQIFVAIGAI
jgi:hypothetical protein